MKHAKDGFGAEFLLEGSIETPLYGGTEVPSELPNRWPVRLGGPGDLWMINL